jgi:hypothetical protein
MSKETPGNIVNITDILNQEISSDEEEGHHGEESD